MSAELKFYSDALAASGGSVKFLKNRTSTLKKLIDQIYTGSEALQKEYESACAIREESEAGRKMYYDICPMMEEIRKGIDAYETIASREYYRLPLYEDMLFGL